MTNSPGKRVSGPTPASGAPAPAETAPLKGLQGGERFPKSMRLSARNDFDQLFRHGHVVVDHVLVVHGRVATGGGRMGISISKRVGNAPCRNRWKRLIREAYRRLAPRTPALRAMDLVVRPRRGAVPDYAAIGRSLASLTSRLDRHLSRRDRS